MKRALGRCFMGWCRIGICLLIGLVALGGAGCQTTSGPGAETAQKAKSYGTSPGTFRARWWNYYGRAASYMDSQQWKEAEQDLREALVRRGEDQRRARTYGMHFVDYFPHRELGVVLYHQERYADAIGELEASLKTEKSAKAEFYLDCTRKAMIQKESKDKQPPTVQLFSPDSGGITKEYATVVEGIARDDTFVKSVLVNGVPVRVDLAAPQVPFHVRVPLKAGDNLIEVAVTDLTGKTSVAECQVKSDRQGPTMSFDRLSTDSTGRGGGLRLKGYVTDDSGLQNVKVNGRELLNAAAQELQLDCPIAPAEASGRVVVEARDRAGNETRAEIPLTGSATLRRVLLASLEGTPIALLGNGETQQKDILPPVIELRNWTNEQTAFVDQIYLEGSVRDEAGVQGLAVNGQSILKKSGKSVYFGTMVALHEGENVFTIEAVDGAGNRVQKEVRVNRKLQKVRELGSRLSVALLPFERKGETGIAGETVEETLLGGLVERSRFEMVERQRLEEILREQKLGRSELADQDAAIRVGKIMAAQGVLMGSILEKPGSVELYARLVDTESSLVLVAVDVYGEEIDPQGIKQLCEGLILKLCDELPLIEGLIVQVKGNRIIADLSKEGGAKKGMRVIIFQEGEPIRHPVTGAVLGADVEEVGRAVVQGVHEQMSDLEFIGKDAQERIKPMQKVITQ